MTSGSGGVLFRVSERLYFLSAVIATKVLPMPRVARVPGAPVSLVAATCTAPRRCVHPGQVRRTTIPLPPVSSCHKNG